METVREYQKTIIVKNKEDLKTELKDISNLKKEHFVVFYLDSQNSIIAREIVHIGTLDSCIIHPREIFIGAITRCAANIIVAHNHPSGNTKPSTEDENITKKLVECGRILSIKVLDHIIVGRENMENIDVSIY